MDELKKVTAVKNRRSLYMERDGGRQQDRLWRQVRDAGNIPGQGVRGKGREWADR